MYLRYIYEINCVLYICLKKKNLHTMETNKNKTIRSKKRSIYWKHILLYIYRTPYSLPEQICEMVRSGTFDYL